MKHSCWHDSTGEAVRATSQVFLHAAVATAGRSNTCDERVRAQAVTAEQAGLCCLWVHKLCQAVSRQVCCKQPLLVTPHLCLAVLRWRQAHLADFGYMVKLTTQYDECAAASKDSGTNN